jgi:hypothetical protein
MISEAEGQKKGASLRFGLTLPRLTVNLGLTAAFLAMTVRACPPKCNGGQSEWTETGDPFRVNLYAGHSQDRFHR